MSSFLKRFMPATLQGQITLVILIAVVSVIVTGRMIEVVRETEPFAVADLDAIVDRASMIAQILSRSGERESEWLLQQTANIGMDLRIIDRASLETMIEASTNRFEFERWIFWLFPPDSYPGSEGHWAIVDDRPLFWMPISASTVLTVSNLPSMTGTSDFVGPLTYYVLAFGTLLVLFSVYAARAVATPVARIIDELDRSDGVSHEIPIAEQGSIEMVRLARALNDMRSRVRAMVDTRMRMLRSVSHDLRTPLTRLRLRAERIEEPGLRDAITSDVDHIDALVTETLDYLRTDAIGEADEDVDIASLLQTIEAEFSDVGFGVRYDGPDHLSMLCRPAALRRAINNLCDNALKFGSEAVITLAPRVGEVWIDVADNGPGIPHDKRSLVLEPFFKLDASRGTSRGKGFGLGLSIVSDIVRAHEGTLEFHDGAPRGLVVRLRLPERRSAV